MIRREEGACHDMHPDLFHPASQDSEAISQARAICAGCSIRLECLALALGHPDALGIWGGLTFEERVAARRNGLTKELLAEQRRDERVGCPVPLTDGDESISTDTADRLMGHLFASGLTLTEVLGRVDDDVAGRIAAVIEHLDAAARDLRRGVFARMVDDGTPASLTRPSLATVVGRTG